MGVNKLPWCYDFLTCDVKKKVEIGVKEMCSHVLDKFTLILSCDIIHGNWLYFLCIWIKIIYMIKLHLKGVFANIFAYFWRKF